MTGTSFTASAIRSLALVLLLWLASASCYATHRYRLEPNAAMSDATGYISRSGTEVSFARPGAKIVNDTLFATGTLGPLSVPADSIAEIRTQGFSPWGSLVVIGAGAAVALGLVYLALANAHGGT